MKVRAALGRLANTIRRPNLESIFFLHIPKCGGTSLRHAMSEAYLTLGRRGDSAVVHLRAAPQLQAARYLDAMGSPQEVARFEEYLLLYFMGQKQTRFIDGHVPFPNVCHRQFGDRFRFITLLRDPVDRWISEYSYNRFHGRDHMRETAALSIDKYLESEFGKSQGAQYVLCLGGRRKNTFDRSQAAIDTALENIEKFELIGCVEKIQQFLDGFQARFGRRLRMPKLNTSPSPYGFISESFTPKIRDRIREVCEPDYVIYNHVLTRLAGR